MKPQIERFLNKLGKDEELKRKFHEASGKEKDNMVQPFLDGMSLSAFKQEIKNVGREVIQSKVESGELSRSDLTSISGGAFKKPEVKNYGWDIGLGETVGGKIGGLFKKKDSGAKLGKSITGKFAQLFCKSIFF